MTIVLATHNPHKRDELREILRSELGDVEIFTLDEIGIREEIEETGTTLEENALLKARAIYSSIKSMPSIMSILADDTGLEVEALGGAPGVYSARYAGENASYEDNSRKLLTALRVAQASLPVQDVAQTSSLAQDVAHASSLAQRRAKFVTVVAYIDQHGAEHLFRGEMDGTIAEEARGSAGFGYDSIFLPNDDPHGRTFAEMSPDEKHAISHRGRALRLVGEYLRSVSS
jgi:XTP/dITP diphosphohydrolase